MKELFYYNDSAEKGIPLVLALQVGENYTGFAIADKEGSHLYRLAYCNINGGDEQSLLSFIEKYNLTQTSFNDVQVAWAYTSSILIPAKHFQPDTTPGLLSGLHGLPANDNVIMEAIPSWQLQNGYSIPSVIAEMVLQKFPAAKYRHLQTLMLKNMVSQTDGLIQLNFETDRISVIAAKEGKLLFSQTYEYSTPEDVLYYLLKLCKEFELSQQKVLLQLSGLIEKESALYRELYQYFICITFREASWGEKQFPAHFFTSLNDLIKCAL